MPLPSNIATRVITGFSLAPDGSVREGAFVRWGIWPTTRVEDNESGAVIRGFTELTINPATGAWSFLAPVEGQSEIEPAGYKIAVQEGYRSSSSYKRTETIVSVPAGSTPILFTTLTPVLDPVVTTVYATTADLTAHINDTSAAHAASAIAFTPTGTVVATTVQDAIAEVATEAGSGAVADGAVTTIKLAADAVTSAKLADDAVGAEHIQAGAVGTAELADGSVTAAKVAGDVATQSELDAVASAKQNADSDLTAIAALTHADDTILQTKAGAWAARTPAQLKTDLALVKGDVGLGNVDNTSDANKPISTAQAAAIDAKATTVDVATALAGKQPLSSTLTTLASATAAGLALMDDADAAAQRATLGAQPLDADLTAIAGLTHANDTILQTKAGAWAARTVAQFEADLKITASLNAVQWGVPNDGTTDASAAIVTFLAACAAAGLPAFFPAGTYLMNAKVTPPDVDVYGAGWLTVFKAKAGLNDYMFQFNPATADHRVTWANMKFDGNMANQTAGGGIYASYAVQSTFYRIHFTNCYNYGLVLAGATGGAFGHHNKVRDCLFDMTGGVSPGLGRGLWINSSDENLIQSEFQYLGGATGTFQTCAFVEAGLNTFFASVFVGAQGGNRDVRGITLDSGNKCMVAFCTFDGVGGDSLFIKGTNHTVTQCLFTSGGDQGATATSSIYLEFGAQFNSIYNCFIESPTANGKMRSFIRENGGGDPGYNQIIGGSVKINGTLTVGPIELVAGGGTIVRDVAGLPNYPRRSKNNFLGENADFALSGGSAAMTSGLLVLSKIVVDEPGVCTGLVVQIGTAGATLTAGQNFVGLFDAAGNRIALSADQAAAWVSTGVKTIPWVTPVTLKRGQVVYAAILPVGTTPPQFSRGMNSAVANANLTGADLRWGNAGTSLTAIPTTTTLSAMTATTLTVLAGLY